MEILFVSTELAPYVKVGGLADVVAALPKALRQLGHKVTIAPAALPRARGGRPARSRGGSRRSGSRSASEAGRSPSSTRGSPSQVDLVLIDAPGLFDRAGVYGERGEDYADNAARFAVLSRAAAEIVRQRALERHARSTSSTATTGRRALVPPYLRELANGDVPALAAPKTVLTIHNLAHQGTFPKDALPSLGLAVGRRSASTGSSSTAGSTSSSRASSPPTR